MVHGRGAERQRIARDRAESRNNATIRQGRHTGDALRWTKDHERLPDHQTYDELSVAGVEFLQEPAERPYGVEAVMRDISGNWLVLVEPREFTPEADA
jgi:hypothetical protein